MVRVHDRDGKPRPPAPKPEENGFVRCNVEALLPPPGEVGWHGKLQKPAQASEATVQGPRDSGTDAFSVCFPALVAFIRDVTYEDGSRRTPGSFLMFVQDGCYTVCLTDKSVPEQVAFQAARTPVEALQMAEDGLRANSLPWRLSKRGQGKSR